MSSEPRELDLEMQLQAFAITLEAEAGETLRPGQRDSEAGADVTKLESLDLTSPASGRRQWVLPAVAVATLLVVVAGLVVLSGDDSPHETPSDGSTPPQSVDSLPETTTSTAVRGSLPPNDIDGEGLGRLETLSSGDVVVPTASSNWFFDRSILFDSIDEGPSQLFTVTTNSGASQILEVYVVPNCKDDLAACEVTAMNGYTIRPPGSEVIDIDGNAWGTLSASAVIGDFIVAIADTWYESDIPFLEDPAIIDFIEGLRVTSMADLPEQVRLYDRNGTPVDPATGDGPEKQAVASVEVRGTTLVLNAAIAGDEVCLTLDRADSGETIWPSGCRNRVSFDRSFVVDLASLASGRMFNEGAVGDELEYLLVGYVDAATAVGVRATHEAVSVDGRSAAPNDVVDGVFVLMSVNGLDDAIDFDSGFQGSMIRLEITES